VDLQPTLRGHTRWEMLRQHNMVSSGASLRASKSYHVGVEPIR